MSKAFCLLNHKLTQNQIKELESKIIPDNYSELSFEEQLAICEKYPNNIYYDATRLIDFNEE
jgi:hypothetical protein